MVSGEENLIRVAQVSRVWALAAALARMCMILSRTVSLKNTKYTDVKLIVRMVEDQLNSLGQERFLEVRTTVKLELGNYSAEGESRYTPADMNTGGQTPGSLPFWRRGLLQNLAGQAEDCSCQLHGQEHHTLAL